MKRSYSSLDQSFAKETDGGKKHRNRYGSDADLHKSGCTDEQPPNFINSLPVELLIQIFQLLDDSVERTRAQIVCKLWQSVLRETHYFRETILIDMDYHPRSVRTKHGKKKGHSANKDDLMLLKASRFLLENTVPDWVGHLATSALKTVHIRGRHTCLVKELKRPDICLPSLCQRIFGKEGCSPGSVDFVFENVCVRHVNIANSFLWFDNRVRSIRLRNVKVSHIALLDERHITFRRVIPDLIVQAESSSSPPKALWTVLQYLKDKDIPITNKERTQMFRYCRAFSQQDRHKIDEAMKEKGLMDSIDWITAEHGMNIPSFIQRLLINTARIPMRPGNASDFGSSDEYHSVSSDSASDSWTDTDEGNDL